jgi:beta-glucosidase
MLLVLSISLAAAGCNAASSLWRDSAAPIDARVASLLAEMTNAEKSAQTIHLTSCDNATAVLEVYGTTGLGACPLYNGDESSLETRNALQAAILNSSRLQIPLTFHTESLHGACGGCVVFPMPAAQASTWDVQLVHDIAATVALEAYSAGIDRGFSPELNVPVDARFGRTEENFSEDPCMTGAFGSAAVLGLHGDEAGGPSTYLPPFSIVSEAKHAAAYAAGGKDGAAADVSDRTLHEIFLRPWAEYAQVRGGI